MSSFKAAYRYANALYEVATERGEAELILNDILFIRKAADSNRELRRMFGSPAVKPYKKFQVIKAIFENKITPTTLALLGMLTSKHRETLTPEIVDAYRSIYNDKHNIVTANITTATPIDDAMRTQIKAQIAGITKKEVILEEKTDAKIIGGYIIRVGDKQDDKSLKSKLTKLQRSFASNRVFTEN